MKRVFLNIFLFLCSGLLVGQNDDGFIKNAGFYTSYQLPKGEKSLIIPQLWFYEDNVYFEARFNYEEFNAISLYFGRTYSIKKIPELQITPVTGFVFGSSVFLSPGINFAYSTDHFSLTSENQLTMDLNGLNDHFLWDWTKASFSITDNVGIGCGLQALYPKLGTPVIDFGPMISINFFDFNIDLFSYNFWNEEIMWVIGLGYNFERKH